MQNTDTEMIKSLRKRLPSKYAVILFSRYQRENIPFSKSLIYKVAAGEVCNTMIMSDLIEMITQHEIAQQRIAEFKKRLNKPTKVVSRKKVTIDN